MMKEPFWALAAPATGAPDSAMAAPSTKTAGIAAAVAPPSFNDITFCNSDSLYISGGTGDIDSGSTRISDGLSTNLLADWQLLTASHGSHVRWRHTIPAAESAVES
jgi:hypothetical protein